MPKVLSFTKPDYHNTFYKVTKLYIKFIGNIKKRLKLQFVKQSIIYNLTVSLGQQTGPTGAPGQVSSLVINYMYETNRFPNPGFIHFLHRALRNAEVQDH